MVVSTAGLLAFVYVLYYARGNKRIGHYVVVLRRVVFTDLLQFIVIYIVFMLGFGLGEASLSSFCPLIWNLILICFFHFFLLLSFSLKLARLCGRVP